METDNNPNKTQQIAQELVSYINMRVDATKLSLVEHLSTMLAKAMNVLIFTVLITLALLVFTAAFIYWLGIVMGSMLGAMLIVGAMFLICALIVFVLRDRMFIDGMVGMLSKMFFNAKKYDHDELQ